MKMDHRMGNPQSVRVSNVVKETKTARTIMFEMSEFEISFAPGQFLMIWVPGVDEIPMSVSLWEPPTVGVTVLPIGEATESLCAMKKNDWLGVRGPFGSSFTLESKKALVVGGGVGMAPLRPLVYSLLGKIVPVTLLIAAKTKQDLIFFDEFSKVTDDKLMVKIATDDGSEGYRGLATDAADEVLQEEAFDTVYTCGPELMMHGLYESVKERRMGFQASLERFMKCGCGVCGTCALDPTGSLVCVDGPVYSGDSLAQISEFGRYHRDAMGVKKKF